MKRRKDRPPGRNERCYWCNIPLRRWPDNTRQTWSREHLIPLSRGGTNAEANIVYACRWCNNSRGSAMSWIPWHQVSNKVRGELRQVGLAYRFDEDGFMVRARRDGESLD